MESFTRLGLIAVSAAFILIAAPSIASAESQAENAPQNTTESQADNVPQDTTEPEEDDSEPEGANRPPSVIDTNMDGTYEDPQRFWDPAGTISYIPIEQLSLEDFSTQVGTEVDFIDDLAPAGDPDPTAWYGGVRVIRTF
ncbi:MAG: hypothetical protein JWQ95_3199 [Sphaerisporangium sp.]|nr:hypothetical protein [Sphaerisporangium sp.]